MVEKTSARPEFVFTKTLWNSLGAVEAILTFATLYAAALWMAGLKQRLTP